MSHKFFIRKQLKKIDLAKVFSCLALAYTVSITPAFSQQIIIDGNTNTNLGINGNVTSVTTSTIKGNNAFNSFSRFNVDTGKVVNLVMPDSSNNLINLVHSEATNINGVLNSVQSGHIGGNIFLVNSHGITVGSQGVVNVGSLTAITPTKTFTDNFFTSPGDPGDASVNALLNGTAPINADAVINVQGKINAVNNVKLDTGNFDNSGEIYAGAVFKENDISIGDVVNINTLESGASIAVNNGEITINAVNNVINTGNIVADGGNNINGGKVSVVAGNNVYLEPGSLISAKGKGENSNGGDIYTWGDNDSYFSKGAILDARGGEMSGDGGFIELSANRNVLIDGDAKAYAYNGIQGTFYIDPTYEDGNVRFAGAYYSHGADIIVQGSATVQVDDLISTRVISGADTEYNHLNQSSTGNSGKLYICTNCYY